MYKSAGAIPRFLFFNPVFKSTKISEVFVSFKENVPDNWTKIGYTFGTVKCRPNKSQIVRVTIL